MSAQVASPVVAASVLEANDAEKATKSESADAVSKEADRKSLTKTLLDRAGVFLLE